MRRESGRNITLDLIVVPAPLQINYIAHVEQLKKGSRSEVSTKRE
jgi:hypothetical protein